MARINIELNAPPIDGMDVKFKAPCDCTAVSGIRVTYPGANGQPSNRDFSFRDCHGRDLGGIGDLFVAGAYVKVILDTNNGYAYLQNADTNSYLRSSIFAPYTHSDNNLIGSGENGKFKATASGTISTINVNGSPHSVRCGEDTTMDLAAGCWYTFILDGNTVNFNAGGVGGLNFKVVGGTAAPASPKENTIWVSTDIAIPGYVFDTAAPASPAEGVVWIPVVSAGGVLFNALKKNALMVRINGAKQYRAGVWENKIAMIYQNGNWQQFSYEIVEFYLFNNGDQCTDITGGWTSTGFDLEYTQGYPGTVSGVLSVRTDYHWQCSVIGTENYIDFTDIQKLYITVTEIYNEVQVILTSDDKIEKEGDGEQLTVFLTSGVNEIDVSHISGSYRLCIYSEVRSESELRKADVTEIRCTTASSGGGNSGGNSGGDASGGDGTDELSLLSLDENPEDDVISVEVDGIVYGVNNATINEGPVPGTYDFTVK